MAKTSTQKFVIKLEDANFNAPVISKGSAASTAENIYNSLLEGKKNPLHIAEMFAFVKEVEKQVKELSDEHGSNSYNDLVREEIIKNSENNKSCTSKYGSKFE